MGVFFNHVSELATVETIFAVDGTATDPDAVSLVVTDPDLNPTTYTYPSTLDRVSTGRYRRDVSCSSTRAGLWQYLWVGTGVSTDVDGGTWTTVATQLNRRYASLELVRDALKVKTGDTSRDHLIVGAILAASRSIDNRCGRQFWQEATASARTYSTRGGRVYRDRDGEEVLFVDDIATESGLIVEVGDGTTWSTVTDQIEPEPDNAIARGRAIEALRWPCGRWSAYRKARITARRGWPALPDEITQAGQIQSVRLYSRKDSPEGVLGSAEWGTVRVARVDPDVEALISDYVLPGIG